MKWITRFRKPVAALLLVILFTEIAVPGVAYALTSGPAQPEMKGFEPASASDMVDLFSGDFSYNIPLLDVGGYPVNLAYQSGSGMDDEATWAGYGWNVNVGSLNRQLRGIPDDFNGSDIQEREMNRKDHITKGGRFSMTLDLLGIPVNKVKSKRKKRKLNLQMTVSAGVQIDNYRGVGAELGANAGLSLSDYAAGNKTKGEKDTALGNSLGLGGVGLNLSSMDGAGVSLNANIVSENFEKYEKSHSLTKSIGFGYNSRAGLTGMTLSGSFSSKKKVKGSTERVRDFENGSSSTISFNGDSYSPTIDHPTENQSYSFTLNLGPELFFALPAIGVTGFYSKQSLKDRIRRSGAFGYLNSEKGKDVDDALMDFNREKDIPYSPQVNYLPIPIPTYDLFSASSQDGGGQYRLYRGSSGIFFDQRTSSPSINGSLGVEIGAGTYFDVGADIYVQDIKTVTQKWKDRNRFLAKGDFKGGSASSPLYEPAYFKRVGETVPNDKAFTAKIKGTSPVAIHLPASRIDPTAGAETSEMLRTKSAPNGESTTVLQRDQREVRNTTFTYLTAREAATHALEKRINDYHPDSLPLNSCAPAGVRNSYSRIGNYRKGHHFSEITITGNDGKRSVYGIPVYNSYQEEVSFSINENLTLRNKGLIKYTDGADNSTSNNKGLENYFSKEKTPAYTTSFLLTGILSPDYVDKTGNGITDDDAGTAVKFNYSKLGPQFNWRTPIAAGRDTANYNEGFLSDNRDDKANYVYGEKEVWYLHSIESKTMIAHFITADRQDALGVVNSRGEINSSAKPKYLKEIRLYSKSDLLLNGGPTRTVPIKTVHFEYDYSICKGLPNSIDKGGKLTLKKVYFTFGSNSKGRLNPYVFSYDSSYNSYNYRQYDRWGNFKNSSDNPGGLNNSEYPYTLQDSALTGSFVSAGQLKQIVLPSGGTINVTYESDDYAYVQDRRASQMCMVSGVNTQNSSSGLINADYIFINLPQSVASRQEMLERYFEGIENLYYKFLIDLDAKGHKEFVPGYAKIIGKPELVGSNVAKIKIEKIRGVNAIAKAGWQFLRMNLPKYAYPGSENLDDNGSDLKKTIQALVSAFGSIKELIYGFDKRAEKRNFSNSVDLSKSWVRLCSPQWKKLGGGSRVKRIDISDDWADMSGTAGAKTATYTQLYDYTITDAKGRTISSGVASYEPQLGNDENPFRQPVRYKQNQFLGLDNYFYIEEPFGEALFPGASVGYSRVSVKSIGSEDSPDVNRTGTAVSEFYTARDYPVKIEVLSLQKRKPIDSKIFKLIGGVSYDMIGLSQGYSIELNDMHGKPKSVNTYNKSGQNISSIEYFYKSQNDLAKEKALNNDVKVIGADGVVSDGTIGTDIEVFTDMRQQTTDNIGVSAKLSGGSGALLFFPLPFFFPGLGVNYDKRSYRASSTIKIVNRFGVLSKVRKVENGSSITTENLLWDAQTGNVLLTKTENEFNDPVYSFTYPAHWVYDGMGPAYRNIGTVLSDFSTGANGQLLNGAFNDLVFPGDELIDVSSAEKFWVINSPINNTYQKRLVDKQGYLRTVTGSTLKLIRSGRRNIANAAIATVATLNNPIVSNRLDVSQLSKILTANAVVFNETWTPPDVQRCNICPAGYRVAEDSTYCFAPFVRYPIPATTADMGTFCRKQDEHYTELGTYVYTSYKRDGRYDSVPPVKVIDTNSHWRNKVNDTIQGPLNRTGVWFCDTTGKNGRWLGYTTRVSLPKTDTFFFGVGGNVSVQIIVDGDTVLSQNIDSMASQEQFPEWANADSMYRVWHIYPVILNMGIRYIQIQAWSNGGNAVFGAELYDEWEDGLEEPNLEDFATVFSTEYFRTHSFQPGVYTAYSCGGSTMDSTTGWIHCKDTAYTDVNDYDDAIVNPYYTGMLGNWREQSQFAYHVDRENIKDNVAVFGNTNVKKAGAYIQFNPFWKYDNINHIWNKNVTGDNRWIAANEVTNFNGKGAEVENRDALNRYSAALFGYLESLPTAVASNARYNEIGYDGFEDYAFTVDCANNNCSDGHFTFKGAVKNNEAKVSNKYAHSGRYSLEVTGQAKLVKQTVTPTDSALYSFDNGRFLLHPSSVPDGFVPIPGKRYLLSLWVKDDKPRDPTTGINVLVNGQSLVSNEAKWPIVEGWKRIEVQFSIPAPALNFTVQLQSSGITAYFDDVRVQPFDGQMKSFAYDPSSQRLWAELDENNFATFYEYDDEGILIRVKKETERGIMTIRETRSSYRKTQ